MCAGKAPGCGIRRGRRHPDPRASRPPSSAIPRARASRVPSRPRRPSPSGTGSTRTGTWRTRARARDRCSIARVCCRPCRWRRARGLSANPACENSAEKSGGTCEVVLRACRLHLDDERVVRLPDGRVHGLPLPLVARGEFDAHEQVLFRDLVREDAGIDLRHAVLLPAVDGPTCGA